MIADELSDRARRAIRRADTSGGWVPFALFVCIAALGVLLWAFYERQQDLPERVKVLESRDADSHEWQNKFEKKFDDRMEKLFDELRRR